MDFAATLFSTGWASGVNAYGTVALLGILGRLNVGAVPDDLEKTPVIAIALGLFLIEFFVDKVPGLDSLWDSVHTVIRPVIAVVLGFQFAGEQGISGIEEAFGAGSTGAVALASHGVKAGLRLAINTSPEPVTNIGASLLEDGLMAVVVLFSINHPELAAAIAAVLLITGMTVVVLLWKRVRLALRRRRARKQGLPDPAPPSPTRTRRRAAFGIGFLVAMVAVAVLVALGVRTVIDDGSYSGDPQGADVVKFDVDSNDVDHSEPVSLVIPPGAKDTGRPLLVFLHGRDGDENSTLVDAMFDELHDLGDKAPIVVAPDGGGSSYWHDRGSGDWGDYVFDEVIPEAIDRSGADPDRVAIGGISMGGFGAFDIARLHPGAFCAVGGHSPAIWATAGETAAGAFDDEEDFSNHDLVTAAATDPGGLDGPKLWLDSGDEDPFLPGDDAFVSALQGSGIDIDVHHSPGGHTGDYWNAHWADYLDFYAQALDHC